MSLPHRRLATALASAALLLSPASALAQSAGDNQYADPLSGDNPQQGSGDSGTKGNGNSGSNSGGNAQQAPSTGGQSSSQSAPQTTTPQTAPAPSSGQLPRTGLDAGLVAAMGAVLLASGLLIRRRAAGQVR